MKYDNKRLENIFLINVVQKIDTKRMFFFLFILYRKLIRKCIFFIRFVQKVDTKMIFFELFVQKIDTK